VENAILFIFNFFVWLSFWKVATIFVIYFRILVFPSELRALKFSIYKRRGSERFDYTYGTHCRLSLCMCMWTGRCRIFRGFSYFPCHEPPTSKSCEQLKNGENLIGFLATSKCFPFLFNTRVHSFKRESYFWCLSACLHFECGKQLFSSVFLYLLILSQGNPLNFPTRLLFVPHIHNREADFPVSHILEELSRRELSRIPHFKSFRNDFRCPWILFIALLTQEICFFLGTVYL